MTSNFKVKYDLIVIGGGPAGSIAAYTAAKLGLTTLMLEKDRDFGIPVRCGEGVGMKGLREFIEPDPKWLDNKLDRVRFHAPDGTLVPVNLIEKGAILNRKVFDFELAKRAAIAGAKVQNRCCATGMERVNGALTVKFEHFAKEYRVSAPLVIGADGVESRVGRWAGLNTNLALVDIQTCFQYTLQHPNIDAEFCDFYFGNEVAPGGYLWIFPKGPQYANVGLGISGDRAKNRSPKEYLDSFIYEHFNRASYLCSIAGSVPSGKALKKIVADGVMLAGDAAHQSDPITGGGIVSAMWGGRLAAQTAVKALEKGDFTERQLNEYTKSWHKIIGEEHNRHYRLKKGVHKLNDDIFNRTARILLDLPFEQRTLRKIFQTALINEPGLVVDIVKAFLQ
ncbi:MAG: NAD(P)/FAD-dependent oxidoreductase [candidate division Zixibacteria bacterium]|nr:NAD(P)/FAD-dependent oxidoreductase [Candidatus Tariuqbacter arcticus]